MKQYIDLLKRVYNEGTPREDRTGTGTRAIFGPQLEFDLRDGFPAVTTKKLWLKGVWVELLWMISGSTNIQMLRDNNVKIWDEWASESGELGPVYGFNWRNHGAKPKAIKQPKPKLREGLKATFMEVGNGSGKSNHPLCKTWEGMMTRCYNVNAINYADYGGKGVHVCDRWLEFEKFAEDAAKLPGYENKLLLPGDYVLDKDSVGDGFEYGPNTCVWITEQANSEAKLTKRYTVEKNGKQYTFTNISAFCRENGIEGKNFIDLFTGRKNVKTRYGYKLVSVEDVNAGVDQLAKAIEGIKTVPHDRRLIVTAWNPAQLHLQALPPCHLLYQFFVDGDWLDIKVYQRSADMFLGVPFDIASYATLLHMVAQVTGKKPRMLYYSFGDTHIYNDHILQVEEQLKRTPLKLPTLHLNPAIKNIDDFKLEDISVVGYEHHPPLKGKVSK